MDTHGGKNQTTQLAFNLNTYFSQRYSSSRYFSKTHEILFRLTSSFFNELHAILLYFFKVIRCLASLQYMKSARRWSFVQTIPLNYMAAMTICVGSLVFELNSLSIILWRLCVHNKVHHAWLSSYWKLKCVHRAVKRAHSFVVLRRIVCTDSLFYIVICWLYDVNDVFVGLWENITSIFNVCCLKIWCVRVINIFIT